MLTNKKPLGLLATGPSLLGKQPSLAGKQGSLLGAAALASIAEEQEDEPTPLDLDYIEGETDEERSARLVNLAKAILHNKTQRQGQQDAVALANDAEFWFAVYFQTREQKEAFLQAMSPTWGPPVGDKYIEGGRLAEHMGVQLPARPALYKTGKVDKKLLDLT